MPPFRNVGASVAQGITPFKTLNANLFAATIKGRVLERQADAGNVRLVLEDDQGSRVSAKIPSEDEDRLPSPFEIGKTYILSHFCITPCTLFGAPDKLLPFVLTITRVSSIQLASELPTLPAAAEASDPEVDRIRKGLVALNAAKSASLINGAQHRALKTLLMEKDEILQAALDVYHSGQVRDVREFAHTCNRLVKPESVQGSSESTSNAPSIFVSSSVQPPTLPAFAAALNSTPLFSFGGTVSPIAPPPSAGLFPNSIIPPCVASSEAAAAPSSPFSSSFTFSPAPAKTMFPSFNLGSPSIASPALPALAPFKPQSDDNFTAVSSLLNNITNRQEAGDDDDLGMSAADVLRAIRSGQAYISFPDCDSTLFAQLCDALRESTGVTNLRVMVDKAEQVSQLARTITNLDISHSAASADDMSELLNALASSTSIKSVNAEFCKLEDNDALRSAIENLLRSNSTLRKLNFDGNYLSDKFMASFSAGLRANRSLELVHFATNMAITPTGLQELVNALNDNTVLKGVHLYANPNLRGSPLLQELLARLQKNIQRK